MINSCYPATPDNSGLVGFIQKVKVKFKIYDVTTWEENNCNTHISQYIQKKGNQTRRFGQLIEYNVINTFLYKSSRKYICEPISRPIFTF